MGVVQLPAVAICSQQTGLQADLRTSLRFCDNSSDGVEISCADDIKRLRTEENLWILPASACRMRISVTLLGRVSGETLAMGSVARWIESCDIWERLKLRVRHCEAPGDSALEFSLQHPDLSASLSCPPTAAKTELQDLCCQIEITQLQDTRQLKKRKRGSVDVLRDAPLHPSRSEAALHGFATGQDRTTEHAPKIYFEKILQAAITVLVTGSARHLADVTVRQGGPAQALAKLIPAVFNVPYIKTISDRTQHMSTITSALTAMQYSAQSPALRRKLWSLADRGGIEKPLWYSILSQVKTTSLPGPKMIVAPQNNQEATETVMTDHGLGSNLICFGEDLFSTNFQDMMHDSAETFPTEEPSSTVLINYDTLENMGFSEAVPIGGDDTQSSGGTEDTIVFGSGFFASETNFDI